jgi:hypothetical protein
MQDFAELVNNPWVNVLWVSCLDRPRTIGEISSKWGYANQLVFTRNEEIIKAAIDAGLFSIVGEIPKDKGTIKLYRAEAKRYLDIGKALYPESKDQSKSNSTEFFDNKELLDILFDFDKIRALCFKDRDIASKWGFKIPGAIILDLGTLYWALKKSKIKASEIAPEDYERFTRLISKTEPLDFISYNSQLLQRKDIDNVFRLIEKEGIPKNPVFNQIREGLDEMARIMRKYSR